MTMKSCLFTATVMVWQTGKSVNWNRVRDDVNGTSYILNTNRLDSIVASGVTSSTLRYFDNPNDSRDPGCYMKVVKTPAELIAYCDTSQHQHITLPVYPDDDTTAATVNHVLETKQFAFAVAHETKTTYSWVYYTTFGYKLKRYLVSYTLAQMIALL